MDFFEMVLKSPGYIFGPLMLLAGLAAVAMCVKATLRPDRSAARRALTWALAAPALGAVGAVVGAGVAALSDQPNKDWATAAAHLGCTVLFGVFVALVPALWALALLRRRPTAVA
jgi:uncharacterized membrane protein